MMRGWRIERPCDEYGVPELFQQFEYLYSEILFRAVTFDGHEVRFTPEQLLVDVGLTQIPGASVVALARERAESIYLAMRGGEVEAVIDEAKRIASGKDWQ